MRPRLTVALGLALAVRAPAQERPALQVDLRGTGPPEALVSVRGLLAERRFLTALESGFPLYMEYRVALRQPRSLRDRVVGDATWEYVVLYDPVRERFTVETPDGTESLPDRQALRTRLTRVYGVTIEPDGPGEYYYDAEVAARTLSDQDVDEAFAWLRGESGDSARIRSLGLFDRIARRVLVEVAPLPRIKLRGRSSAFQQQ